MLTIPIIVSILLFALSMVAFATYARSCVNSLKQLNSENAAIDAARKSGEYGPSNPEPMRMALAELPNTMRGMGIYLTVFGVMSAVFAGLFSYLAYLVILLF